MQIFGNVNLIINAREPNVLLSHSDAYPTYQWKLERQFAHDDIYYKKLSSKYDLNKDYFQTTMMLFDTNIITNTTFSEIYELLLEYPNCIQNDQSIIALYFICVKPGLWKQIQLKNDETFFYDYCKRTKTDKYIMIKYNIFNY
jgi:uracil phosphoribosyltransferase